MLALALTNKKDFMNKFLKTEIFDHFLLQELSLIHISEPTRH